jgi:hypothetical protein
MKSKQTAVVFILFSLCLTLALLGGTWQTASAVGTVPVAPPTDPLSPIPPVIPVTGACAITNLIKIEGVSICVPEGAVDKKYQVALEIVTDTPGTAQITPLTPVVNVFLKNGTLTIAEYKFNTEAVLTLDLSASAVETFKKNPLVSLMHYDSQTNKWVKVPVTVRDNQAMASISSTGLYVLAIPRP